MAAALPVIKEEDVCACVLSRVRLCSPMEPGSSVHGIPQARILEWAAISSFRDLPDPGIESKSPASLALQADSLLLSHLHEKNTSTFGKFT